MCIKHIYITNSDRERMLEDIVYKDAYIVHVSLSNTPDKVWKHFFYHTLKSKFLASRRKVSIVGNEIRIILEKNDDIQGFIEMVKKSLDYTDRLLTSCNGVSEGMSSFLSSSKRSCRYKSII